MPKKYIFLVMVVGALAAMLIPYFGESYSDILSQVSQLRTIPEPPPKPAFKTLEITPQGSQWYTAGNQAAPIAEAAAIKLEAWVVQLGSFSNKENARQLAKKIQALGYPSYVETNDNTSRVLVGPVIKRQEAEALVTKIEQQAQLKGIIVAYDPLFDSKE